MNAARGETDPRIALIREISGFREQLAALGLDRLAALSSPSLGEEVTRHRSSWVRRLALEGQAVYVKTYDYPTRQDRWRGLLRTTFLAPSRALREWRALRWLRRHGLGGPRPMAVAEKRHGGWLQRAVLVTEAHPGQPLDRLLSGLAGEPREALLQQLVVFVDRLHATGFRDRNLDLRNLLAQRTAAGWEIAKIDSPRYRIVPPGRGQDRLARADRARLAASLAALGLEARARQPRSR